MNTYQIHVDTASVINVGGTGTQPVVSKTNFNPFQATVLFGNRHRAFRSITLRNAQIPIGYYNIRAPYNTITFGSTTYTVSPGNYSSTSFLAALNSATSAIGSWSYIAATNQIQFTSTSGTVTLVIPTGLNYPTLANLLGFVPTQTLTGTTLTSQNSYILNFDTYISIWIENLGQSSLEPAQITFKIPINVPSGSIMQWADNSQNVQTVLVTDRNARVDRLNITVLDRFGNVLNNNGIDWSFTIEVDCDN
jgi:hypothetical protein